MEIGSSSLIGAGSRCCSRILFIPLFLLCGPLFCCCLVLGAAGRFIQSPESKVPFLPTLENILPVQTMPVIPAIPAKTPSPGSSLPQLDSQATPLFGSTTLKSGFSPDPYSVNVDAGGNVDTSGLSPACGYTSFHPAFVLHWESGNVPKSFLRIFFTSNEDTDATLLVRTPKGEWQCGDDSVLDFPSALSGQYAIWVGTREDRTPTNGSLFITDSRDVTP